MNSFIGFLILLIIGIVLVKGHDFLSKVAGVVVLCIALNPLCVSLTGSSVWGNIQKVVKVGDKAYNGVNDSLKGVRETVTKKR